MALVLLLSAPCQNRPRQKRRVPHPAPRPAWQRPIPRAGSAPLDRPYNIVLCISDEEAYHIRPAAGVLDASAGGTQQRGITFHHYIAAAMCTPSRGVMFSGQPPQVNGVFDQMESATCRA